MAPRYYVLKKVSDQPKGSRRNPAPTAAAPTAQVKPGGDFHDYHHVAERVFAKRVVIGTKQ